MDRSTRTETFVKTKCVGGIKHVIPGRPNSLAGTAEALGFSLRQVIPSIWELTKLSFLVDYFVNVGDLLNTAVYGDTNLYYACCSTVLKSEVFILVDHPRKGDDRYWTYKITDIDASATWVTLPRWSFTREILSPWDAGIRFSIPYSGKKWVNMVALFTQWYHGKGD